jgi:hypothetical protein
MIDLGPRALGTSCVHSQLVFAKEPSVWAKSIVGFPPLPWLMPNGSRVKTSVGWLFDFLLNNLQLQSYENLEIVDSGFMNIFRINQPLSFENSHRLKEGNFFWELCLYILKTHHENHQLLGAISNNHSTLVLTRIFSFTCTMYAFFEKACCFAGIWYYETILLASTKYFRALVCIPPMCNDPNIQLFFPSIGNDAGCGNMSECCWIFTWYWDNDGSPLKQISS